jgi:hypothetical protein
VVPFSAPDPQTLKRQLGGYVRRGNLAAAENTRRVLKAAKLEQHIRAAVDAAPPLTDEQRSRLAILLRGGETT